MIKIEALKNYTIPYYGNKRIQPYGDLVISDSESRKTCKIQDDGAKQYFTFNRKRYAGRGDTKDVGKFKPFIVCHMPELVKVKPNKQHGNGNDFMNAMENVINNSDSQAEAGIMCIALAMAGI